MANTSQASSTLAPIFTGENYDFWSIKMKTFFCSQDLWDVIEDGFTISADILTLIATQKELKENKQKDSRALYILQQAIDDATFPKMHRVHCKRSFRVVTRYVPLNFKV